MLEVWIIVESDQSEANRQMVLALKQVVLSRRPQPKIWVGTQAELEPQGWSRKARDCVICPLVLELPSWLVFPGQLIYQACRDVLGLRQQLIQWQYSVGSGHCWLPIALTAKGPLYAEVIGIDSDSAPQSGEVLPNSYFQPVHLSDGKRQVLYGLAARLLRSLAAPPAVYLMQFGFQRGVLCFDRLWPFPAAPAIASLNRQNPDLFACHWFCITGEPIYDLLIRPTDYCG